MDTIADPADALNELASAEGWPFRCDTALEFDRPELNMMRDMWLRSAILRIPSRADLTAPDYRNALRHMAVLDRLRDCDGRARYRISYLGSYVAAVLGDHVGSFLDETLPPELLPRWIVPFDAVLDSKVPMRFLSRFEYSRLDYAEGESFVAPLLDDAGEAARIMSVLYLTPRNPD